MKTTMLALATASVLALTACANQPNQPTSQANSADNGSSMTTNKTDKPFTNADHSASAYEATVSKGKVSYKCQNNKSVTVTYGFDKDGKATYASAMLEGKERFMPLNFQRSDNVGMTFGDDNSHRLGTSYMTSKNYQQQPMLITNQANQIIFKNCFPK